MSLRTILADTPEIPESCQWVTFLRNHDELTLEMVTPEERAWMWDKYAPEKRMRLNLGIRRRLAPLLGNDRRQIELAYNLLLTLPGSPIVYYGDEIGMGDNIQLPDRNGVRTPMQWKAMEKNGGYSLADELYAPVIDDDTYGYDIVNVESQYAEPNSLFHAVRHMIMTRKKHPSFGTGALYWVECPNKAVACYIRSTSYDLMLSVSNLGSTPADVVIKLPSFAIPPATPGGGEQPFPPHEIYLGHTAVPGKRDQDGKIFLVDVLTSIRYEVVDDVLQTTLEPYQFLWLDMEQSFFTTC